ncbi:MAG: SDR family NAD(P)-dependent oxidoreductase [Mangrovicoccus sp.]
MTVSKDQTPLALVTGASRGLGYFMARDLARAGYHVMAVARTVGGLEELDDDIKALGGRATLAPLDITDDGAMQHLCRGIYDRWGGLDLWLHTAIHAAPLTPTQMIEAKDWDKSLAINLEATRRLIAYCNPLLEARPGARAVFFDDPDRTGAKFFGSYGATKGAQMALARSWQAEQVSYGPEVVICEPCPLPTATRARFFPGESREALTPVAEEAARLVSALALAPAKSIA